PRATARTHTTDADTSGPVVDGGDGGPDGTVVMVRHNALGSFQEADGDDPTQHLRDLPILLILEVAINKLVETPRQVRILTVGREPPILPHDPSSKPQHPLAKP